MGNEPARGSRPIDFANLGGAYWTAVLLMAATLIFLWFDDDVGPGHPVYALIVTLWALLLVPGVAIPVMVRVPPRWFRVPAGEHLLHRACGVAIFGWLLDRSGYNRRFVYPMWDFPNTRAGLASRAEASRGGASAHGACCAIHILVAAAALLTGYPWGALWILLPGVVLHLYPVLLQRAIMLRLQRLLDKRVETIVDQRHVDRRLLPPRRFTSFPTLDVGSGAGSLEDLGSRVIEGLTVTGRRLSDSVRVTERGNPPHSGW